MRLPSVWPDCRGRRSRALYLRCVGGELSASAVALRSVQRVELGKGRGMGMTARGRSDRKRGKKQGAVFLEV